MTLVLTDAGRRLIRDALTVPAARVTYDTSIAVLETLVLDAGYSDGCCWVTERARQMGPAWRAWLFVDDEECAFLQLATQDARRMLAFIVVVAAAAAAT